jgi:hypothetical protein
MKVQLNIYSGRPNPEWPLSEQQAAEVTQRLTGLPHSTHDAEEGGLGYSGFTVWNPARRGGLPEQIRVLNGVSFPGQPGTYTDIHDVEGYLLALAYQQGHGPVLQQLGVQRAAAP